MKYGNKKIEVDGVTFDSKAEARRYGQLKLMQRAGVIEHLSLQVAFELAPSVVIKGRKRPPLKYIADFVYVENGQTVVEDTKGFLTDVYRIKRHLMRAVHGIEIKETA